MMNEGEEENDKPPVDEAVGPKIKMGRIGKKKKNNARDATKEGGAAVDSGFTKAEVAPDEMDTRGSEGFTE